MKILIEMSPEHYDRFLEKRDAQFNEYSLFKHAVVLRREVDAANVKAGCGSAGPERIGL
jgi:hypothetical protein